MNINQVAVQLYTCRDLLKTPADIAATLEKIRAIGYTAVQVSGMGPIAEEELVKILDGEGLVCCATHEPGDKIINEPQKIVERLQKLKCKITAYPYPGGIDFNSEEKINELIKGLDAAGKVLAKAGQILCYHNHNIEFRKINGKIILDKIYEETNKKYLQGEPDTFWVQSGGGNVVDYCKKLKKRLPILHLKDYRINDKNQPEFCEIGAGNLDFKKIIAAAESAGCQWYAVEQDSCPGDPLDSITQSFQYIQENLVS
jgi:sugar phosphate isomerase/epimerase